MQPATKTARALLGKLERLADPANGGTPDEIAAANHKLERLRMRYDFSAPDPAELEQMDIFKGIRPKRLARRAAHLYTFRRADFDIANSVKWAIEEATGIPCHFRGEDLSAAVTAGVAKRLAKVAMHISQSFQTLLDQFEKLPGVTPSDRRLFIRGLYDGMMNDPRGAGERLPGDANTHRKTRKKKKKTASNSAPKLAVHPYTVALALGRQIRFAAPVETIAAELERATQPALGSGSADP
jgi:hypothetical protein